MLVQIYKKLLKLYPEEYQKRYKQPMLQTMEDMLASESSANRRCLILTREIAVTPFNALEQTVIAFSARRRITPQFIMSTIALGLLLPFFIAITIDEISEFTTGGHLYNTWLWSGTILFIWIIALPFTSLVLSLSIYIISLIRHRKKMSFLAKKYWLIIITILLSAGILSLAVFHDSVHCWLSATSINTVVTCTESSVLNSDKH